jgi:hypothetical protein
MGNPKYFKSRNRLKIGRLHKTGSLYYQLKCLFLQPYDEEDERGKEEPSLTSLR